jgi:phosphomannomutase
MINFLFDIDGTLTPPRQKIPSSFRRSFGDWVVAQRTRGNRVFLVTGSNKTKTKEQVGVSLWRVVNGCYQNCGNQLYVRGRLIKQSAWKIPVELRLDILELCEASQWFGRAKINIEERVGMVNISTVGRSASRRLRTQYYIWDAEHGEREGIVTRLSSKHPNLEYAIGGEISIDIYPNGKNKSQVLEDMTGDTVFFGDKCDAGGNDYHISQKVDRYYHVEGWRETKNILETVYV